MKKRILSILLTLCMVLCIVPVPALADDTALRSVAVQNIGPNEAAIDTDLYEKMSAGINPIKLIADINLYGTLSISQEVIIDLNGHALKMADSASGSVFNVESNGHLTIEDSNPAAVHKFTPDNNGLWVLDEQNGTETVSGGIITGGSAHQGGGVYIGGGTFTMTGGSIVGCTATQTSRAAWGGGVFVLNGQFTMTGGRVVGCTAVTQGEWDVARGGGVFIEDGTFKMSAGSITDCTAVAQDANGIAWGGGICNYARGSTTLSGTAEIRNCHAKSNKIYYGGGICDNGTLNISDRVTISNCTAGGSSNAMYIDSSSSTISGGTFNGDVTNNYGTISGGTFYGGISGSGSIDGLTVTYRVNKADYAVQVLQSGEKATKPIDPVTTAGYDFSGWFTSEGATYDFSAAVTENLTLTGWLYAPVTNETDLKAALADDTVDVIQLTDDIDIGNSLTITRKVTVDLNGYVLKGDGTHKVFEVSSGGDLTIIDSNPKAVHKFNGDNVLWVLDETGGDKTVNGGVITGGYDSAGYGGGVNVTDGGRFTMNGGNIAGCKGGYGGGVRVSKGSTFTMNGGCIVGCSSTLLTGLYGQPAFGGVHVTGDEGGVFSTFTMTGGVIKDCGYYSVRLYGNGIMNANGGEVYGEVGVDDNSRLTGLTGHTGVTVFRDRVSVNTYENSSGTGGYGNSSVDWGLFYKLNVFPGDPSGLIVTYMINGVEYAKQVLPSGTLATRPDDPATTPGYTFGGGWNKADGTAWDYATDTVTESITLYADLTAKTYTVTFDTAGGSEVTTKTITATYGKPLVNMPVPRREGYVFLGWYDSMVGGKCYGDSDGNGTDAYDKDGNITLYAQWTEAPSRMVRFNKCGGTMTDPVEVWHKLNTPIARPSDPTKVGYTFTGWYTDLTYTQLWNFDDWVTGEMMLYAGWKVNRYTITFDTAGGSKIDSITQDYGTTITTPANPTREGYTFIGWNREVPETMPAENVTITALWKINRYTITFDTAGGSKIDSITQDYGTAITAPANPTREGYTFVGWNREIPETMPAGDITIKALWKDVEKPTGEIKISENSWKSFLNNITFGLFFKDTQTVTITAADNSGDAVKIEYLLSAKELTEAELASAAFTTYTAPFGIDPDNEYIIYVRLTDKAGNTDYICSDGIVLDGTNPVIKGIENGKIYCEAHTVTIDEKYIDTVIVNKTKVTLDENKSFVLSPADGQQKIVVTDKAGNTAEMTVTVNDGHTFGEWKSNGDGTHTRKCTVEGCQTGIQTENCTDADKNHICDYCGKTISNHEDTDNNHVCDYCKKVISNHEDADKNHVCDYCGKTISNHEDTDSNHVCDYCEKVISNHEDADKNHVCDYCGKTISNHEDTDKNHICDYCKKVISNHEDADKNHVCDYCGETISNHEDTDKNHICDYCEKIISNHEDADKNHICDYCGKIITNHTGGKATCAEKAVCEFCGKAYGELDGNNHSNLKHIEAKAATKDAGGNTEYWHCEACGKYYNDAAATKEIKIADTVTAKLPDDSKSPKTGDNSNLMLWFALLFISGGICTAVTVKRKKITLTRR